MNDIGVGGQGNPDRRRTSATDPLRIAEIEPAGVAGRLGITFCPGKQGDSVHGRPWHRNLEVDLDAIEAWGACVVVSLIEHHEFESLNVSNLGARIQVRGIEWLHLPIVDLQPPGEQFEANWPAAAMRICEVISKGERVLVHCRGGLGRAGTVAACILVELGAAPLEAIRLVRRARPHAIETSSQERYVRQFTPRVGVHTWPER